MDSILLYLLIVPLAALFIAEYSGVIQKLKYWLFYRRYTKETSYHEIYSLKPFSCPMCLSFWLAALTLFITYSSPIDLLFPFAAAGAAVIIQKLTNK